MKITVVVPAKDERPTLERLVQDIIEHIAPHRYRILFVDDGSTDGTWEELQRLHRAYPQVEALRFARNQGKTAALAVAFREADGDVVLTLDADLQDDPAEIPRMVAKLGEGYGMVCGWKQVRHDPWHKTIASRFFNRAITRAFGMELHDINTGFKAMRLPVAQGLLLFADMHRMLPVQAHEQGYPVTEIPVTHHPRQYGASKFGAERIYRGLRDAFTVWLMFRCKNGPARHFGHKALYFFTFALATLAALWLASAPPFPLYALGIFTALTAIACGTASLALGLYGLRLRAQIPARTPVCAVAERIGGE